jgi:hypothetical protein
MTYYSKYLKYKNKYLELKNMIGGNPIASKLGSLHQEYSRDKIILKENTTFYNKFASFKDCIHNYSWIGPPAVKQDDFDYGNGFFIFNFGFHSDICKESKVKLPNLEELLAKTFELHNNYGMLKITKENIGDLVLVPIEEVPENIKKMFEKYNEIKLMTQQQKEAVIKAAVIKAAENALKEANEALKKNFDEVKNARLKHEQARGEQGKKDTKIVLDNAKKNEKLLEAKKQEALKKLEDIRSKIKSIVNIFNTSIELPLKDGGKLPPNTNYMFDGNSEHWIYQSGENFYKAKLIY